MKYFYILGLLGLCTVSFAFLDAKIELENYSTSPIAFQEVEVGDREHNQTDLDKTVVPFYDFEKMEERFFNSKSDTTYVINFWATWCKPCIEELPVFERTTKKYHGQKVKVVLVSLDFPRQLESRVIPFLEREKLSSEVLLLDDSDANSWIPKVSEQWSGAIPATIVVKQDKEQFHEGLLTFEQLEKKIKLTQ